MKIFTRIFSLILISSCINHSKESVSYYPPENANYQYEEVGIRLHDGDILAGSMTFPKPVIQKCPVAILITGSSPHDRDNSSPEKPLNAYRPFRQIAHLLSSNGIAVLRVDDRGVGKSKGGNINEMNTLDRAGDIEECISYIKRRHEFDRTRICLIGLSEGASIAHLIAAKDSTIKIIALLSAVGSKGSDVINFQIKNGLIPAGDLTRRLKQEPNMRFLYDYDPIETIRLIHQPVLIISGERDRRVPASDAYILADELQKTGNGNVSVHILPDYNHLLLKEDSAGIQSGYGMISSNQLPEEVLDIIMNWILLEI
ncbi:MAG: prolyl oligopeptidase family serine peptidase [Bacteroidales bacterium]